MKHETEYLIITKYDFIFNAISFHYEIKKICKLNYIHIHNSYIEYLFLSYVGNTIMDESRTEEEHMDFSLEVSEVNDDSLYVPTLERSLKKLNPVAIPKKVFMVSFEQLNLFVETINSVRCCVTPGCKGILVPLSLQSKGLGGTVNVSYVCNGCSISKVFFEGSVKSKSLNTIEVGASIQVAFIISGCLYATYCKVLKLSPRLDTVDFSADISECIFFCNSIYSYYEIRKFVLQAYIIYLITVV